MSAEETIKVQKRLGGRQRRPAEPTPMSTVDIASYIATIVQGMRGLTRNSKQKDLQFLDNLLAVVEEEAATLSSNVYH